jgi:hypothetical protein
MAGRQVFGKGCVFVITPAAYMGGNPFVFEKDLDMTRR